jgi:hypothetical protein
MMPTLARLRAGWHQAFMAVCGVLVVLNAAAAIAQVRTGRYLLALISAGLCVLLVLTARAHMQAQARRRQIERMIEDQAAVDRVMREVIDQTWRTGEGRGTYTRPLGATRPDNEHGGMH